MSRFLKTLQTHEPTDVGDYRGISASTLSRAGCYVDDDGWFCMPYLTVSGKEWYVKKRNPVANAKPKYLPDRRNHGTHLYNPFNCGPNVDEVWFVEGELDTLTLLDLGVSAVGYPGTASAVEADGGRFRREWYRLFEFAQVVVAAEADVEEAKRAVRGIMNAWSGQSYRFDPAEYGFKDVNDWLQSDRAGLESAVAEFREQNGLA